MFLFVKEPILSLRGHRAKYLRQPQCQKVKATRFTPCAEYNFSEFYHVNLIFAQANPGISRKGNYTDQTHSKNEKLLSIAVIKVY